MRQPFAREDRPATELQLIVGVSSASGSMISRVAPEVQFMRSVLSPKYDPSPSQADIQMTKAIIDVAAPPGISVHDHIIVGRGGACEFERDEVDLEMLALGWCEPTTPTVQSEDLSASELRSTSTTKSVCTLVLYPLPPPRCGPSPANT
jgi:hypothetical protein